MTNQKKEKKTFKSQWELRVKLSNPPKARENAANKSWLVWVLHLIGLESVANFLDQTQSEVKTPLSEAKRKQSALWVI